jgi:hypothetical protein
LDDTDKRGSTVEVKHALPIVCQHCGEVTRLSLSTEQALRLARGLTASALGEDPDPPEEN